ncbi:GTP-binding protein [Apophysomyces sp. BC1034]|nr:GTP-binding protein [Apophysomyces sp. BC1034]
MAAKARQITVLGARAVGKSSLTIQFCQNQYVEQYYPTIENSFTKTIKLKGQGTCVWLHKKFVVQSNESFSLEYTLEVLDTAGQDEYSIFNSHYATGIHGYVLVYSITSRTSFDMVKVIHDKILDYNGVDTIPCVLVANKTDLNSQRSVSTAEGQALAQELKALFIETSAKKNENISKYHSTR